MIQDSFLEQDHGAPDVYQRAYDKAHSWQYDIRLRTLAEDLVHNGMSEAYVQGLTVKDFTFAPLVTKSEHRQAVAFIKRYEWLGTLSQYTTHWFGAWHQYHGQRMLAGVILMNMPNAFSKLLGDDTPNLERLISRGACISWSPRCLASSFMMWSIRWMAQHTAYRLFTAYADPSAKELGTIYQACNFYYLGQDAGTKQRYINPYTGKVVSDRFFRQRSAYKRYARDLGIEWQKHWNLDIARTEEEDMFGTYTSERLVKTNELIQWHNIPPAVAERLRAYGRKVQDASTRIVTPAKHKYAMVLGKDNRETKYLRRVFEERNKTFPYPKQRGE